MLSMQISASTVAPKVAQRVRPSNAKPAAPKPSMQSLALAAGAALTIALTPPALADLNRFEYNAGGEFGVGSALQYGEADLKNRDFSKQDLTRSNFTAADCRNCNFTYERPCVTTCRHASCIHVYSLGNNSDSKLTATYFIKSVLYKANFTGANLSDALMDRAVLNEANLTNAVLERVVLTRSDLTGAIVEGADFSNALVDREQQIVRVGWVLACACRHM